MVSDGLACSRHPCTALGVGLREPQSLPEPVSVHRMGMTTRIARSLVEGVRLRVTGRSDSACVSALILRVSLHLPSVRGVRRAAALDHGHARAHTQNWNAQKTGGSFVVNIRQLDCSDCPLRRISSVVRVPVRRRAAADFWERT